MGDINDEIINLDVGGKLFRNSIISCNTSKIYDKHMKQLLQCSICKKAKLRLYPV